MSPMVVVAGASKTWSLHGPQMRGLKATRTQMELLPTGAGVSELPGEGSAAREAAVPVGKTESGSPNSIRKSVTSSWCSRSGKE